MITLKTKDNFSLQQTLECGQCFRFQKIQENEYWVQTKDIVARIKQKKELLEINSTYEDEDFWKHYFDLETDYGKIQREISKNEKMEKIVEAGKGIHLLNQDFFETLISFIMSQNKQIPQIKQCIELFSQKYGNPIIFEGKTFFAFPEKTAKPTLEGLKECKVGFRDKYILDAFAKLGTLDKINSWEPAKQKAKLKKIKGIGDKVSNCILLFSLGRREEFPVDVWIHRRMQDIFGCTTKEDAEKKGKELFGKYAGYAQQYLFFYKEKES